MHKEYARPAAFFFLLQAGLIAVLTPNPETRDVIFWYCNSVPLFLGLAFLLGRIQIVKGLTDVGLVIQLLWIADFILHFFGIPFFHITDYVFQAGFTAQSMATIIVHATTPFMALRWTWRVKPQPISLLYSFVYILALYGVTLLLTSAGDNINYIFHGSDVFGVLSWLNGFMQSPAYIVAWPLLMMPLALIGYSIQLALYSWSGGPRRA